MPGPMLAGSQVAFFPPNGSRLVSCVESIIKNKRGSAQTQVPGRKIRQTSSQRRAASQGQRGRTPRADRAVGMSLFSGPPSRHALPSGERQKKSANYRGGSALPCRSSHWRKMGRGLSYLIRGFLNQSSVHVQWEKESLREPFHCWPAGGYTVIRARGTCKTRPIWIRRCAWLEQVIVIRLLQTGMSASGPDMCPSGRYVFETGDQFKVRVLRRQPSPAD